MVLRIKFLAEVDFIGMASPKAKFAIMTGKIILNVEHVEELTYSSLSSHFEQQRQYFQYL